MIDRQFDGYLTQFKERWDNSLLEETEESSDLRYDHVINEYFKLFGLLTIEACFNLYIETNFDGEEKPQSEDIEVSYVNINQEGEREQFEFQFKYTYPKVDPSNVEEELTTVVSNIDPNEVIETVINQINY